MKFRTELIPDTLPNPISHDDKILTIGSCFADTIATALRPFKFNILQNPWGTLYHPIPIARCLQRLIDNYTYSEADLHQWNNLYHSYDCHGSLSGTNPTDVLTDINHATANARTYLLQAQWLFITFGSSYGFYTADGLCVANCHKEPANRFTEQHTSLHDLLNLWTPLLHNLRTINPKLQFMFTVSPIRHWSNNLHKNQLSKATLLLLTETLCQTIPNSFYFPSYELILDDLRDYRFYDTDLCHINPTGIEYILEKFMSSCMSPKTIQLAHDIQKVVKASKHRILHPSDDTKHFAQKMLNTIQSLELQCPSLNFETEKQHFQQLLQINNA